MNLLTAIFILCIVGGLIYGACKLIEKMIVNELKFWDSFF